MNMTLNSTLDTLQETMDDDDSSIEDEDLSYDWSDKDEDEENLNYDWSVLQRETLDDDWTMSPENETSMESIEKVKVSNSYKAVTKSSTGEKKNTYLPLFRNLECVVKLFV